MTKLVLCRKQLGVRLGLLRVAVQMRVFPHVLQQVGLLLGAAVRVAAVADVDVGQLLVRRESPALDLRCAEPAVDEVGDRVNAACDQEHRPPLGDAVRRHPGHDERRNNTVEVRNTIGDAHQGAGEIRRHVDVCHVESAHGEAVEA